ncbi:MAG: MMPL family transporter [Planctomycetales bacterium]|nr:MMPL family transporter [Planctomycetales bacterium]NIM08238.1 MMPL family transporter [Planctomycetales bacterium]NIN07732.1 MMPL family transporter [Planctomycetales bacterium]NIN76858.1 MMPL family transporter [Planctomycetales bacterium]NIO34054.1 MMPL family transporter [Planctomycetales bacterium]
MMYQVMKFVTRWMIRWRYAALLAALVAGLLAYPFAQELAFDRSIENMFAADDPLLEPYRRLKKIFGNDEVVLAAYVDPQLMTPAGVGRVQQLTQQLAEVEGVQSAMSLASTPLGERIVDDTPAAARLLELLEGYAVGPPLAGRRETAAVVCVLQPLRADVSRRATIGSMRQIVRQHDPTGVIAGEPVMVIDGFEFITQDGETLGYTTLILLSATILLCFRSLRWVAIPLVVIQFTLVLTRAILVSSHLRLSMVSSMLTAIVTVVAVATVIHFIVRFRDARAAGASPLRAVARAGRLLAIPIALACVTDAVGFAALLWARVGPVQDFGIMMAIGSLLVIVSVAFLVPGLALWGRLDVDPRRAWGEKSLDTGLSRLVDTLLARPKTVGAVSGIVALGVAIGGTRLQVETNFTRNFRASSEIARSYAFVESRLGGAGVLDVIVPAPAVIDDAFLDRLRKFQQRLHQQVVVIGEDGRSEPGLTKVLSVVDLLESVDIRDLIQVMAVDELLELIDLPPAARRLMGILPLEMVLEKIDLEEYMTPQQQLQMVELAMRKAGGGAGMLSALRGHSVDGPPVQHFARVMLRAREQLPAQQKTEIIRQVERIAAEEFPASSGVGAEVTGFYVLLTSLVESMIRDQWICFAWAVAGIGLMMLIAFRSPVIAAIAIVPNAVPILMVTGLMGWLNIRINMGAAMIAAVSMGLSIDSSIHYVSFYRRERRAGRDVREALHNVHQSVGRAMFFATLALIVGFTALCRSQFVPTVYFGALVSLSMLGALLGNLVVLPLLLMWMDAGRKSPPS